jgi:hypothetical protein
MPGRDDEPIFKAEQAPPTVWDQIATALGLRKSTTPTRRRPDRPQGARDLLLALGTALVGAVGGVLFLLGVLGVGMSLLLVVTLVVTRIQGLQTGIQWPVVPVSLLIFGASLGVGYLMLRAVGMFRGRRRR